MIDPEICIALVDRQWVAQWRTPDGITHRKFFGNRKVLCEDMPRILTETRGLNSFPPIDETIDIHAPRRRATDVE